MIAEIQEYLNTVKMDKSEHTVRSYEYAIKLFLDFIQAKDFSDIEKVTSAKCREFQSHLMEDKAKSSINAYVRPLKALFNWLIENEYLTVTPFGKVKYLKTAKVMPVFLSEEEISAMINACKNVEEEFIFTLMLTTGLRRNELVKLKLVDIEDNHILVHGKGSKDRRLILQPAVVALMKDYLDYRNTKYSDKSEYLLVSKMSCGYSGESIRQKIQRIGERAGLSPERLEKIHPHTLRHTFATNLVGSGADIRIVQGALGHANLNTTMIYAHLRDSALDNAMLNVKSF
jgi:site-specific recombinase XerD